MTFPLEMKPSRFIGIQRLNCQFPFKMFPSFSLPKTNINEFLVPFSNCWQQSTFLQNLARMHYLRRQHFLVCASAYSALPSFAFRTFSMRYCSEHVRFEFNISYHRNAIHMHKRKNYLSYAFDNWPFRLPNSILSIINYYYYYLPSEAFL